MNGEYKRLFLSACEVDLLFEGDGDAMLFIGGNGAASRRNKLAVTYDEQALTRRDNDARKHASIGTTLRWNNIPTTYHQPLPNNLH